MFFVLLVETLTAEEQQNVEFWLSIISGGLFVIVVALLLFAVAIRHIARSSTHPCRACMEFIPKTDTVCPRCGKAVKPG